MIHILGSGRHRRLMDMEYITGLMVTDMKASGKCVLSMVKVQTALQMAMFILVNMLMVSLMAKVNMSGQQVKFIPETFSKAKNTVKVNGEVQGMYKIATFLKEITKTIVNMEKVFLLGPVETFTKEIMLKMKDKETVKCCGLMEVCTKENGSVVFNMDWVEWSFQMVVTKKAILRIMSSDTLLLVKILLQVSKDQDLI